MPIQTSGRPPAPTASARINLLLDDPRAPQRVAEMSSLALHQLLSEVGRHDATDLLALARPEQLREVVDLAIWRGDRVDLPEALDWLHMLLTQLPDENVRETIRALDVELVGYILLRHLRIHLADDEEAVPEEPEGALMPTPDGWFVLELLADDQTTVDQLIEIVDRLYRDDPDHARRTIQSLMGEFPTELEEWSYRWRLGRLQDLGFADPETALLIYAYLDPGSVKPGEQTADRPLASDPEPVGSADMVPALQLHADCFWSRALGTLTDEGEQQRIAQALVTVSNRALSADRVPPTDVEAARISLDDLHWRLSIGLEHLCGGDLARAAQVLASVALLRVARVGHSLALDRRRRVLSGSRATPLGRGPGKGDLLDAPLRDQIAALLAPRPRRFDREIGDRRPFRDLADLAQADRCIDRALSSAALMQRASLPSPLPGEVTYGDLFRTALVNHLLDRRPQLPVGLAELSAFLGRYVADGRLRAEVVEAALRLLGPARDAERDIVREWTDDLGDAVGRLDPDRLDLRFVGGLWLDR